MKGSGFPPGSPGSFQRSEAPSNTLSSAGHLVDRSDGVQDRPSPDHETRGRTNAMQQNWFSDLTKPNVVPEGAAVSRRRRATKACCQPGLHSAAENLVREPVDWGLWKEKVGAYQGDNHVCAGLETLQAYIWGGGFDMTPGCIVLVCSWWRLSGEGGSCLKRCEQLLLIIQRTSAPNTAPPEMRHPPCEGTNS
eukprot:CAMPEP_0174381204 /NCGR_PEP_ID=MMETSP0811_2-20130205/123864_1 /TAXON_ID=73025 ORGANISM="Eutreptiella gymnastica-like, Strain CCMP1594" /NCGR_SAMPLE_ID=MMETSP0811_2 /ASSEMBLY_ACC=CAM_ASM_000667 /LENGTH=192 /DNA_ID=CAMNT_0015534279 /DNA_START=2285 /DNA_END=2861 /DNA_ORIENTATION=+